MITLTLTSAQRSALECAGLGEGDDEETPGELLLLAAWNGKSRLTFAAEQREALMGALTEACNSEDAFAENSGCRDARLVRLAHGACQALCNLSRKVRTA